MFTETQAHTQAHIQAHTHHEDADIPLGGLDLAEADGRRNMPRAALSGTVVFRNGSGQVCRGRLVNLSAQGMQVRCHVAAAQTLHPVGGRIQPGTGPLAQAKLDVPSLVDGAASTQTNTLNLGVRLLYLASTDIEPRCILGFEILNPRPRARRQLEALMAELTNQRHEQLVSA